MPWVDCGSRVQRVCCGSVAVICCGCALVVCGGLGWFVCGGRVWAVSNRGSSMDREIHARAPVAVA